MRAARGVGCAGETRSPQRSAGSAAKPAAPAAAKVKAVWALGGLLRVGGGGGPALVGSPAFFHCFEEEDFSLPPSIPVHALPLKHQLNSKGKFQSD